MDAEAVPLRLVEWNVAMSLQSKTHLLTALKPTVAILPESAHPDRTWSALEAIGATSVQWVGGNANKGLLAVACDGWDLRIDDNYDPGYQWVMPLHLFGPMNLRLLAVWDMGKRGSGYESARKLGACRASLEHYSAFLSGECDLAIISGDFNNSVHWDTPMKTIKFGDFMDQIADRGFVSAYHLHHGFARGAEQHPTLWWTRNAEKTYHIDYTFVSDPEAVESVIIGRHQDWLAHSDHSPMIVDIRIRPSTQVRTAAPERPTIRAPRPLLGEPPTPTPRTRAATTDLPRLGARMRFELERGELNDMLCGVNGVGWQQTLRPTYVTAEWRLGRLAEVRVWGPRVLKDDRVGTRMLDHVWHDVKGSGPVKLIDLPPLVASRIRAHAREEGLSLPSE